MKKHTIIGTAGHIDHGKTALIKALTNIDTDRLKEEKERGITIDIGFAYWKDDVTIIDVPGHEKFIRNMVAGVSTIDFFILVIAADDGIMPQTIEHLDILNFFYIRDGIVVINKIDLVDEEWLMLVKDEVENLLKKYNLENLPVVEVSSINGENIEKLKGFVENKIANHDKTTIDRPFRLLVDRSFSVKGFGTVVTGTVLSGSLQVGENIQILPSCETAKVRGLQEHIKSVEFVEAGDRAAINLQNISREDVVRGDVLANLNTMIPVNEFFGIMRTVSDLPVRINKHAKVRIHVGTAERMGKIVWFDDTKVLEKEKNYHVKIKLDFPVALARNDVFLVRLHSPVITLAGGKIIEINPVKVKNFILNWQDNFRIMSSEDYLQIIETLIHKENLNPVSTTYLQQKLFENISLIEKSCAALKNQKKLRSLNFKGREHFIHEQNFKSLVTEIEELISNYHKKHPHKSGTNLQEIIGNIKYKNVAMDIVESALRYMINSKVLQVDQNIYSLNDFKIKVSKETESAKSDILSILLKERYEPSTPDQMAEKMQMPVNEIRTLLNILNKEEKVIQINSQFYVHAKYWNELLDFLRDYFSKQIELPVSTLKDFIQTTRKFAIPLFEYLDSAGFTRRIGNNREKGTSL